MGQPLFQWDSTSRFGREGGAAAARERLAAGIEPYAGMISSEVESPDRPNAQRNLEAAGSAYDNAEQLMGQVEGVSGNDAMKGLFSQAQNADWAGMAHGIEIRVPLVDPVLFAKIRAMAAAGAWPGKRQMAETVTPPLPPEILDRRKTGFFVPVADWVQGGTSRGYRGWASEIAGRYGF